MLTELRDWTVKAHANGEVKVVADFPQTHLEDVLRLVCKLTRAKHPDIEPGAWVFSCHPRDGGQASAFTIAADGQTVVPCEAFPGAVPVGRA